MDKTGFEASGNNQGDGSSYRHPKLISLGSIQTFVLGGPNPAGTDVALPEIDGSAS